MSTAVVKKKKQKYCLYIKALKEDAKPMFTERTFNQEMDKFMA